MALVQGLTEYLPISSTAHLILLPRLFGWADQGLAVDVAANTGTLLAVIVYFRRDLAGFVRAFLPCSRVAGAGATSAAGEPDSVGGPDDVAARRRLAGRVGIASIGVLLFGFMARGWIGGAARNPEVIAWATIGFGLLLGAADRWGRQTRTLDQMTVCNAAMFGLAQAVALIPGGSRAGLTITAGRLLGFDRETAARFSFLMAIPAGVLVLGKNGLDLMSGALPMSALPGMLLVAVLSAIVGYLVIGFMLAWVRRRSLQVFVVYRLVLGAALLVLVM